MDETRDLEQPFGGRLPIIRISTPNIRELSARIRDTISAPIKHMQANLEHNRAHQSPGHQPTLEDLNSPVSDFLKQDDYPDPK